ncbi:Diaminopimelate dehydrogenase, Ddh [Syntrophomonas zehnderi OL-4]|uniref:Meso-diaminopimelate D-dehydrogenase n=1 Tax=Syntrophomonas zehnderi OL-4 TaxID=690567 RepID=A0A0E4GAE1_9FIRM|nr:diaminopimelate dehydrogenase [Syntrophomonas zehnderi]CFX43380.1 Diaminopimelate dehydrogenase, Ddh [Syntrophomonas zehnderi OL-4]
MQKFKVAVLGYGNIGKFAVDAIQASPDMQLEGIVEPAAAYWEARPSALQDYNLVESLEQLPRVDVALLCIPSRAVPETAAQLLAQGINTVDSYDIHGQLSDLRIKLDQVARQNDAVGIISAGWDPGTDSIIRCMFEFMMPRGITYTNFGPGMSMGHSVAAKAISGVKNALSMTIPVGTGVHRRMVYVQLEAGADFNKVSADIKNDPYFANDETIVNQVQDVNQLIDMGHAVSIERKGVSGLTHNQLAGYSMKVNNPALTAQIMVSAARAGLKQKPGAYTIIQIPPIDFLYGDKEEIIRRLV